MPKEAIIEKVPVFDKGLSPEMSKGGRSIKSFRSGFKSKTGFTRNPKFSSHNNSDEMNGKAKVKAIPIHESDSSGYDDGIEEDYIE